MTPAYADLEVTTNFTFLRGASHAAELAEAAAALGHPALGVTDRNSLAGAVRMHSACKAAGIHPVIGARLDFASDIVSDFAGDLSGDDIAPPAPSVLVYPTDRTAYGRLTRLLTLGRRRAPKGECLLTPQDLFDHEMGLLVIALPSREDGFPAWLGCLKEVFADRLYLAARNLLLGDDRARIAEIGTFGEALRIPLVATNDIHLHTPARKPLEDVLACIREGCTIDALGRCRFPNAERHLKSAADMARLFADHPAAIARTVEIAERASFSLDELRYEYPIDTVPDNGGPEDRSAQAELEHLTWQGARARYPGGVPDKVRAAVEHELELIAGLEYAPYFLTVHDIVRFARSQDILCQGRGSAANSAVCYCLAVTAVDPAKVDLLFERFVSAERNEPPDIDVDFEHERREEVIQYIYERYGRSRAGLAATVISYRARSAVREVGKVMGLSEDVVGTLAGGIWGWSNEGLDEEFARETGLDPDDPVLSRALALTREIIGFPRHLSQHVGGFVITRGPLDEVVPVENAAMVDRTVIQWDKDDLDALGILKIDVLGLGMLTCIRKGFDLLRRHEAIDMDLATVPPEDPATYDMLCEADSVGVFQVESRAQMTMLPRLRPRAFYDLVIEVAIVRPGPIQGDMVHPYLRRRNGKERVSFPSQELADVLGKTLGVPLFQEQAMKIAIVAAGFTPSEADRLRRAMATFKKTGTIHGFREKMIEGMVARGYERDFAERCFRQIEGFGDYGFPESHAASFALLVYVSAWMKCHHPAVFACALLNSQPMGFYAPAQIVRDAREHGVEVRAVDVNASEWDCTLEPAGAGGGLALRLGFRQIKGFGEDAAAALTGTRGNGWPDPWTLWRRSGLGPAKLEKLVNADAFASMGLTRRDALWAVRAFGATPLPLFAVTGEDEQAPAPGSIAEDVVLPVMSEGEEVIEDYAAVRLTLRAHPLALLRDRLPEALRSRDLMAAKLDSRVTIAGLVLVRQRPGTAKGVVFMTLEDETGVANIIVWRKVFEGFRRVVLGARLVAVTGRVQREGIVIHVVAETIADMSHLLGELAGGPEGDAARHRPGPQKSGKPQGPHKAAPPPMPRSRDFH